MFTPKLLRRRWVLALIFTFSLFYFAANIYKQVSLLRVPGESI